ncbi:hypothetical protein BLX91_05355 [Bacillus subtilis]|nr:hypothetical protein BLX91_05355 [Bacillus subtilis]
MLSITSVDTKKRRKRYPHARFQGQIVWICLFSVKLRNLKNKVSKVEKVWYPIMVARNKSTSEVDNE